MSGRDRARPPSSPRPPVHESLLHMLGQWVPSAAPDLRGWTEQAGDEQRLYLAGVASGALTAGAGQELGDNPAAEEANRLRSAASLGDQRAWSLDADQRRSYMLETIRRSPVASPTGVRHCGIVTHCVTMGQSLTGVTKGPSLAVVTLLTLVMSQPLQMLPTVHSAHSTSVISQ